MSTTAKVFVVLNLLLAVAFLGAAATFLGYVDTYRKRFTDEQVAHKATTDRLAKEVADVTRQNVELGRQVNDAQKQRDENRAQAEVLKAGYDQMKKSYDELNASHASQTRSNLIAQTTIKEGRALVDQLQNERQALIDKNRSAEDEKDAAIKMQNKLELDMENATAELQSNSTRLATLEQENQRLRFELESIKRTNPNIGAGSEQPAQSGKILAADPGSNIVVISLGSEDGVRSGFRYTVSRGRNYVGTIEITDVQTKQAAGRSIKDLEKSAVRSGDDVMTSR